MELKTARKQAGMTIQELADAVGVSAAAICRYEKGQRTPNTRIAKEIGKTLRIPWFEVIDNRKEA